MNLLEFNDAELSLYRDGQPIYAQPGIAHVATAGNLFGFEALRIARLHPQAANQQYLARLNADPLPVPGKLAANHADLVYQHLLALKACLGNAAPAAVQVGSAGTSACAGRPTVPTVRKRRALASHCLPRQPEHRRAPVLPLPAKPPLQH